MAKKVYVIILLFFFNACSFDNQTGIWTGSETITKKQKKNDQNIEFIFKKQKNIIENTELSANRPFKLSKINKYSEWPQSYQNKFNNIDNVSFFNEGRYKKLSKISNTEINNNILINKNSLFFSDDKGNIGIFSLNNNQLTFKYNFYQNRMKKTKKNIKLIIKGNLIIAADNFGYIYAIDYIEKKLKWAKNYLVPFRSNLKIIDKVLFLSDEKNKIILINIENGNKIDELYTQPSKTVSKFESNLAIDDNNNLLFLSTSGTLYSLNLLNRKIINWIQNFKSESEIIFNGNPIIVAKGKIIISTKDKISLLNINGQRIWDLNLKSNVKPIISGNTIFTVNDDNFLVFIDKDTGEIIYSKNIYQILERDFKKKFQKKIEEIKHIYLTNDKLLLISKNLYFIEINIKNNINTSSIKKNPFTINSDIIFLEKEMIFVSNSKRIYKVN